MEPNDRYNLRENRYQGMKKRCEICVLHDALSLFDAYAAWASSAIINHRLCPDKRKYLALCALLANEPDEVVEVADAALNALTFGMPSPPFSSPIDEAQWWSERASPYENLRHTQLIAS